MTEELLQAILAELQQLNKRAEATEKENRERISAANKSVQSVLSFLPEQLRKAQGGK